MMAACSAHNDEYDSDDVVDDYDDIDAVDDYDDTDVVVEYDDTDVVDDYDDTGDVEDYDDTDDHDDADDYDNTDVVDDYDSDVNCLQESVSTALCLWCCRQAEIYFQHTTDIVQHCRFRCQYLDCAVNHNTEHLCQSCCSASYYLTDFFTTEDLSSCLRACDWAAYKVRRRGLSL